METKWLFVRIQNTILNAFCQLMSICPIGKSQFKDKKIEKCAVCLKVTNVGIIQMKMLSGDGECFEANRYNCCATRENMVKIVR